jgi:hypothetical protein
VLVQTLVPSSDDQRRDLLYSGAILAMGATTASRKFCDFAWNMICEAFAPLDPETAQQHLSVEEFVEIVAQLKPRYTHSTRAVELLRDFVESYGCDPEETFFDLPKLRIVTHSNYLTAGVGYAYQPHRDVWYSCPESQSNWWTPLTEIVSECSLGFYPHYWRRPVPNSSQLFDAFDWNASGRATAASHVKSDPRNHPQLTEAIDLTDELRLVVGPASALNFSAAHLHATVPNTSGRTRFSVDFRTAHIDDLLARRGAEVVDSASTGTTIYDFRRTSDLAPVPPTVVSLYDPREERAGALVYHPPSA